MDKHLNCFYSYNSNEELIENNLTRSYIVTLMGISNLTRNYLLSYLYRTLGPHNYNNAEFALQNNISVNPKLFKHKYIIALATDSIIQDMGDYLDIDKSVIKETLLNQTPPSDSESILDSICGGSIPDAWIYDPVDYNYCFLIECKSQGDYLYYAQIVRHAYQHYGLYDIEVINSITSTITWDDILESIARVDHYVNEQEQFIVNNFIQFLGFFGFSLFRGFDFNNIPELPRLKIIIEDTFQLFHFRALQSPIELRLIGKEDISLFNFDNMPIIKESYIKWRL